MKKHAILIASALLLAGCSAPAAAPAESSAPAETPSAAASSAVPETTPAADPSAVPASAAASGPRMTTEQTCTELMSFIDPSSLPGGGDEAEMEAVTASMRTIPDRASDDLKDVVPAMSKVAEMALADEKNATNELDKYLEDPVVFEEYMKSYDAISGVCFPEVAEEDIPEEEVTEGEFTEEEYVEEEIAEEEITEPAAAE